MPISYKFWKRKKRIEEGTLTPSLGNSSTLELKRTMSSVFRRRGPGLADEEIPPVPDTPSLATSASTAPSAPTQVKSLSGASTTPSSAKSIDRLSAVLRLSSRDPPRGEFVVNNVRPVSSVVLDPVLDYEETKYGRRSGDLPRRVSEASHPSSQITPDAQLPPPLPVKLPRVSSEIPRLPSFQTGEELSLISDSLDTSSLSIAPGAYSFGPSSLSAVPPSVVITTPSHSGGTSQFEREPSYGATSNESVLPYDRDTDDDAGSPWEDSKRRNSTFGSLSGRSVVNVASQATLRGETRDALSGEPYSVSSAPSANPTAPKEMAVSHSGSSQQETAFHTASHSKDDPTSWETRALHAQHTPNPSGETLYAAADTHASRPQLPPINTDISPFMDVSGVKRGDGGVAQTVLPTRRVVVPNATSSPEALPRSSGDVSRYSTDAVLRSSDASHSGATPPEAAATPTQKSALRVSGNFTPNRPERSSVGSPLSASGGPTHVDAEQFRTASAARIASAGGPMRIPPRSPARHKAQGRVLRDDDDVMVHGGAVPRPQFRPAARSERSSRAVSAATLPERLSGAPLHSPRISLGMPVSGSPRSSIGVPGPTRRSSEASEMNFIHMYASSQSSLLLPEAARSRTSLMPDALPRSRSSGSLVDYDDDNDNEVLAFSPEDDSRRKAEKDQAEQGQADRTDLGPASAGDSGAVSTLRGVFMGLSGSLSRRVTAGFRGSNDGDVQDSSTVVTHPAPSLAPRSVSVDSHDVSPGLGPVPGAYNSPGLSATSGAYSSPSLRGVSPGPKDIPGYFNISPAPSVASRNASPGGILRKTSPGGILRNASNDALRNASNDALRHASSRENMRNASPSDANALRNSPGSDTYALRNASSLSIGTPVVTWSPSASSESPATDTGSPEQVSNARAISRPSHSLQPLDPPRSLYSVSPVAHSSLPSLTVPSSPDEDVPLSSLQRRNKNVYNSDDDQFYEIPSQQASRHPSTSTVVASHQRGTAASHQQSSEQELGALDTHSSTATESVPTTHSSPVSLTTDHSAPTSSSSALDSPAPSERQTAVEEANQTQTINSTSLVEIDTIVETKTQHTIKTVPRPPAELNIRLPSDYGTGMSDTARPMSTDHSARESSAAKLSSTGHSPRESSRPRSVTAPTPDFLGGALASTARPKLQLNSVSRERIPRNDSSSRLRAESPQLTASARRMSTVSTPASARDAPEPAYHRPSPTVNNTDQPDPFKSMKERHRTERKRISEWDPTVEVSPSRAADRAPASERAPPGIDPRLYFDLPLAQRQHLQALSQQMMAQMNDAAQKAKYETESQVGGGHKRNSIAHSERYRAKTTDAYSHRRDFSAPLLQQAIPPMPNVPTSLSANALPSPLYSPQYPSHHMYYPQPPFANPYPNPYYAYPQPHPGYHHPHQYQTQSAVGVPSSGQASPAGGSPMRSSVAHSAIGVPHSASSQYNNPFRRISGAVLNEHQQRSYNSQFHKK